MFNLFNNTVLDDDTDAQLERALCHDPLYEEIIKSPSLQRLKGVSFLGAIDKTHSNTHKQRRNRFQHSVDVAKLALFICKKREYPAEIENHVVAAALLHDVGHAPLSHSMEMAFYEHFEINHHIATERILNGKKTEHNVLHEILKKKLSITLLNQLIEQRSNDVFADIFNSPINVDTIDGIHKSLLYFHASPNRFFNRYSVASAAFLNTEESSQKHLDNFWQCKGQVYNNLINTGIGALADYLCQQRFYDNTDKISEEHFYRREESFFNNKSPIFKTLISELSSINIINCEAGYSSTQKILEKQFVVTDRDYIVDSEHQISQSSYNPSEIKQRYLCKKNKTYKTIKYNITANNSEEVQLELQYR